MVNLTQKKHNKGISRGPVFSTRYFHGGGSWFNPWSIGSHKSCGVARRKKNGIMKRQFHEAIKFICTIFT